MRNVRVTTVVTLSLVTQEVITILLSHATRQSCVAPRDAWPRSPITLYSHLFRLKLSLESVISTLHFTLLLSTQTRWN